MPIAGVVQPEQIQVDEKLRLRKYDGVFDFALEWYQDEDTVYLMDGVRNVYTMEKVQRMYSYLDAQGELYFIEYLIGENYVPIGDVTFWQEDMPIVIGSKAFRGCGIGRKVIAALVQRGRELGYEELFVDEIYAYNVGSQKCFESLGFYAYEKTPKGSRYRLSLSDGSM